MEKYSYPLLFCSTFEYSLIWSFSVSGVTPSLFCRPVHEDSPDTYPAANLLCFSNHGLHSPDNEIVTCFIIGFILGSVFASWTQVFPCGLSFALSNTVVHLLQQSLRLLQGCPAVLEEVKVFMLLRGPSFHCI